MAARQALDGRRQQQGRRPPEHALDVARLGADHRPVGQQRVQEHAVPQPVDAEDDAEPAAALLAEQHEPARLEPLGAARARGLVAGPERAALGLRLGAQRPVAADPGEVAARGLVGLGLGQRPLGLGDLGLQPADLLEVLELGERGLDDAPDGRLVAHGLEQERRRAVAQPELALDRLRRARRRRARTSVTLSRASSAMTHLPSGSMPRRPARPAIWVSSLWVRLRKPRSVRLVTPWSTTLRAGMWMPRLIVSVAKTTRTSPRSKSSSVSRLRLGRIPAWWTPTPSSMARKIIWFRSEAPSTGFSSTASPIACSTSLPPGAVQERPPLAQHLFQGALAADPAEDEVDGGEPLPALQLLDHRGDGRDPPGVEAPSPVAVPAVLDPDQPGLARPHGVSGWIRASRSATRYWSGTGRCGMDDRHDRPVDQADPLGDLVDVGDGGGEPDQRHVLRGVDDDLLPHRPPPLVAHVVALVEHDVGEPLQGAGVEHVAEDLGRHDQERRARVDLDVPGQDADLGHPELPAEVGVLLVGERLERRRVGDPLLPGQRLVDGELGDQRLAGAGRGGDDHRRALEDRPDGRDLEVVERERVAALEAAEEVEGLGADAPLLEGLLQERGWLVRQGRGGILLALILHPLDAPPGSSDPD